MKPLDTTQFENLKDKSRSGGKDKGNKYHARLSDSNYRNDLKDGGKKEVVVKVVSQLRGGSVKRALDYIERANEDQELQLDLEDEVGRKISQSDIEALYDDWRQDFEPVEGSSKKVRHATHMLLSVDAENTDANAQGMEQAARELLREELGDKGYRYSFVVHRDTDNPHVHVIVNNYHIEADGPKLRLNQPQLFQMRSSFAEKLRDNGIEQVATFRRDRDKTLELMAQDKALEDTVKNWLSSKIKTASLDPQDLKQRKALFSSIVESRQAIKETGKETESSMKALEDLRALAKSLTITELYSSPKSAFSQINSMESENGTYSKLITAIRAGKVPDKTDKSKDAKRVQWQARKMAFDIAEGELAAKSTPQLSEENKQKLATEFNAKMEAIAPYLAAGGAEKIRFITQQRTAPDNDKTAELAKLIRKLDRSTPTLEKRQKEGALTDKHIKRTASEYFSAQESLKYTEIPQWRKNQLKESLQAQENTLSRVANVVELRQEWKRGKDLSMRVQKLSESVKRHSERAENMKPQSRSIYVSKMQQEASAILENNKTHSYDKKQAYTVNKSISAIQKSINDFKGNEHNKLVKEIGSIDRSLTSLSNKQQVGPLSPNVTRKLDYQAERTGLRIVALKDSLKEQPLTAYDKQQLSNQVKVIDKTALKQGVDLSLAQKQSEAINTFAQTNEQLMVKVKALNDLPERRHINSAIELLAATKKQDGVELLPTKEKRVLVTERRNIDVLQKSPEPVKQKVKVYFNLDTQIKDLARFADNTDKKYKGKENRTQRRKTEFVLGKKSDELQQKIKKSDLPRRIKTELSKKIDKSLKRFPGLLKDQGRELRK